ncbi:MAG: DNA mismatch repair protein MutS [Chlamydiales bacterium]|nr:DNA mismatch repair protein MutS [Chlamydiales bacterium]
MMEQWRSCKERASDAVLLFRMGDFYEAFYDDAEILADVLDLTLTKRQGTPMAGVPWHTCENYVDRLVNKGYRVAIAEQTEDPKQAKGLVKREIVRFITPGTVVNLPDTANNFIAAIAQVGALYGLAFLDLTTASFQVVEFEDLKELLNELYRLNPSEILTLDTFQKKHHSFFNELSHAVISTGAPWQFEHKTAYAYLTDHFQVHQLDGFGLKGMVAAINAAGGLLSYIRDDLSLPITHIREIKPFSASESVGLDRVSQKNLELTEALHDGSRKCTLMGVLDHTYTPMGRRLLREWIKRPLLDVTAIQERLDAVEAFYYAPQQLAQLRQQLKPVRDLERLMMRIVAGYATPRDLLALAVSLEQIAPIQETLKERASEALVDLPELYLELKKALVEEPPLRITEGKIFRDGYHAELDEHRELTKGGREWLARYQTLIKEETGIKNLKVSFNKVFGYYIEVSKGQAHLMPDTFQRRQTLVNSERFISPILKEYETKVLSAEERIHTLEQALFQQLRDKAASYEKDVFACARALARLDVLASLALVAKRENYCRPVVDTSDTLHLEEGRHPVVEALNKETFIPNETTLDHRERLMLITGPNMAGKSTYIRQVALIVIMAQMGSFVPCTKAHIGVIDKIFTRIGASDDLSRGQSTFMVEMSETANILNNVSARSLVILDEIGRGTSTYDGVAIAWSVAEYLLKAHAKTLFATHYWELTELEESFEGAVNYHATVLEERDEIVFMHRIARGGTDRSYGIHVARLAGLPPSVIGRAQTILKKLEVRKENSRRFKKEADNAQLSLF